ncbi:MAG: hypothetical protein RR957_05310, partial [Oscillospiraceae bacterium]
KLDGTAKGGIVLAIKNDYDIPVKLVGVGEGIDDIEIFNAKDFVDAIIEVNEDSETDKDAETIDDSVTENE